ncbi:hypothetical protein B0T14DRAFT_571276 [Immersiella caudata]|uniref:Low temperature requirement A n=1 Tax=Immersiella caudata TaxID=314043 RepID=A0AA39TXW6_9PEZI|nr:hypothetical protein B0T14DRAFT_571276 [Immersiella caudata]
MAHKEPSLDVDDLENPKLQLLSSPLIRIPKSNGPTPASTFPREQQTGPDLEQFGYRDDLPQQDIPEFRRHADATAIEVFYDLFFAANLTVFSDVIDINNTEKLATFVVYFSLLWFNWALLGLYDVRFITDSIFERCARAVHFGVMVSFAVIAPNFSLSAQQSATFQTMSVILMTSRLTMAVQYATILWYCRNYRRAKVPLACMIALNFVAGIIYLGIGFSFSGGNRALYSIWFVVTAVEVVISAVLALKWDVLSFQGTHLASRVSLLTFILMGEGLCALGLGVVRIVQNSNSWTPPTIGNVTAGVANIYLVFMIYFDWRRSIRLGKYKQLLWSFLHFPFHLAMRIFIEGSSQFVVWWKVLETMEVVNEQFMKAMDDLATLEGDAATANLTDIFVDQIDRTVTDVFNVYVPKYTSTHEVMATYLEEMRTVPNEWWIASENLTEAGFEADSTFQFIAGNFQKLGIALENSLLAGFKIDGFSGFTNTTVNSNEEADQIQWSIMETNAGKFNLVYKYAFIAAGVTLILMNVLFIITSRRWKIFDYFQKTLNFGVGIALCLITLNLSKSSDYAGTPWPLPTLVLVLFAVLVVHHLPSPPPILFGRKAKAGGDQGWEAVNMVTTEKKVSGEGSDGPGVATPGFQETDTLYRGAGAHS